MANMTQTGRPDFAIGQGTNQGVSQAIPSQPAGNQSLLQKLAELSARLRTQVGAPAQGNFAEDGGSFAMGAFRRFGEPRAQPQPAVPQVAPQGMAPQPVPQAQMPQPALANPVLNLTDMSSMIANAKLGSPGVDTSQLFGNPSGMAFQQGVGGDQRNRLLELINSPLTL